MNRLGQAKALRSRLSKLNREMDEAFKLYGETGHAQFLLSMQASVGKGFYELWDVYREYEVIQTCPELEGEYEDEIKKVVEKIERVEHTWNEFKLSMGVELS
jgi:hypothetical protein